MNPYQIAWEFKCDSSIISVAGTANLSSIVAGTVGKSVYLLNGEGESISQPFVLDHEVWAVHISEDGQFIAAGTANKKPSQGTLYVYTRSGKQFWSKTVRSPIWNVKLTSDAKFLIATTWKNEVLLFKKNHTSYDEVKSIKIPGNAGLYGCEFIESSELFAVASYETGLYFIDYNGEVVKEILSAEGFYNISFAKSSDCLFVGLRDGSFRVIDITDFTTNPHISTISQRPICGISATSDGSIIASGSFDSRVIVSNEVGDLIWDYRTKGEVWSTVISSSGRRIAVGCGDHMLRVFNNLCSIDAYQEIRALEKTIYNNEGVDEATFQTLIQLYARYNLTQYGYNKLNKIFEELPALHIYKDKIKQLLVSANMPSIDDCLTNYNLGLILSDEKKYDEAIRYYQIASLSPSIRSLALRKASECFEELGLRTAATASDRQSRVQYLDYEARHVLYNLARSYDDSSQWKKASKVYEMLLAWDMDFRNAYQKLKISQGYDSGATHGDINLNKDYTGHTTSLLGPDVPKNIDTNLNGVIQARSKEILINPGEAHAISTITYDLLSDPNYSRGIKRDIAQLDYDKQLFLKYDYGLPEDEMKKFLETVNSYPFFESILKRIEGATSLDIGSATGRYPTLLTRLGFNAQGIDIEERAIQYSIEKKGSEKDWPKYTCGDALEMEKYFSTDIKFDLITCMMGTFEHIAKDKQKALIEKVYGRLNEGGICIISVWDTECPHLAYLSMYNENQKELIRSNSRTQKEMESLFSSCGFSRVILVPFALMPHTLIYDLGIERFQNEDVEIATQADLATRALFKDRKGEMFLTVGIK